MQITAANWRPVCNEVTLSSSYGKIKCKLLFEAYYFFYLHDILTKPLVGFKEKPAWKTKVAKKSLNLKTDDIFSKKVI